LTLTAGASFGGQKGRFGQIDPFPASLVGQMVMGQSANSALPMKNDEILSQMIAEFCR
jgi:hypothetical protein